MRVIMRNAIDAHQVYAYCRSILNRDGGKIIAVISRDGEGKHSISRYSIIAEVNDPREVDIGYSKLLALDISTGFYNG